MLLIAFVGEGRLGFCRIEKSSLLMHLHIEEEFCFFINLRKRACLYSQVYSVLAERSSRKLRKEMSLIERIPVSQCCLTLESRVSSKARGD